MTDPTTCSRCGATYDPGTSPRGLCPRCLLGAARGPGAGGVPGAIGADAEDAPEVFLTSTGGVRRAAPPRDELAPHFDGYEIGELLGSGGMGAVYRAEHKGLGRAVALKVLHRDVADQPGFAERFEREARTLARLEHANVVTVFDCGRAGPWFYFAMELVDGASLRQMMLAREVAPREALSIVAQLCDALQYAHDTGVVHRDIKPENVLVDRKGRVKILDFGLAKLLGAPSEERLTHTHQVMGTPHYMAPEQWERPRSVDHRADIFSLGVVFYELLTGELPVGRFAPPSNRVAVDVRLDEVVLRTLEREPERRYQQASHVRDEVDRIREPAAVGSAGQAAPVRADADERQVVPPLPAPARARVPRAESAASEGARPPRSNSLFVVVIVTVVALYALMGLVFLVMYLRAQGGGLWPQGF